MIQKWAWSEAWRDTTSVGENCGNLMFSVYSLSRATETPESSRFLGSWGRQRVWDL